MTDRLTVLLTNITLASRTGTEIIVRDVARGLLARGHTPVVYSTSHGEIAEEIRSSTIPVVADLANVPATPDVIHGHHHPETMTALLQFPGVPAVFFSHDALAWHDVPPRFPRIRRYVAVDDTIRDRLLLEHGLPAERVRVLLNAVDLERFRPRAALPSRPARALLFSNYATEATLGGLVREVCARADLALDVIGANMGKTVAAPEAVLGHYDIVFAKGRSALEALAVGTAVVLCGTTGLGPMVTAAELERLRRANFGRRVLAAPLAADLLLREIARYDAADAVEVMRRVRATAGFAPVIDELIGLYREAIAEQAASGDGDLQAEARAAAVYVRQWGPREDRVSLADHERLRGEADVLRGERDGLQALLDANWWKFPRRALCAWRRRARGGG